MKHVLRDLWETRTDSPFPGLTTHAYLWTPANVLFYSPATDAQFDELAELGGVRDQYLSHRDEAGPMLTRIKERFGSALHAHAGDIPQIHTHASVDVPLHARHTDYHGIEIIPTPGHSPGSVCHLVQGDEGRYLFTGDTLFRAADGRWLAGYIPGFHRPEDAETLAASLRTLADLAPDIVISSAFQGDSAVHRIEPGLWRGHIAHAIAGLPTGART
ncbi:glyoxylase-like metal-dependent hydrolase (beta-lactamase superfamily II) [Mycolicibacterium iranicum]|uniref:Glyoxylase-like metal-dependent hydrolase (Beta-lactamase superfamily II) n=1 Tax=Mycolicibacterium iranicum TaxID=912594 RepID=A0A839QDB9_MYCIR|nr:MBL fold metallo-hydrolase [Mycolicibacterium iranicum]MBB2993603.1 glyoxylase-like metal-dependent hydrolase (beta-lactamase superfamily II) [Mycolicibacterium iranicum]